MVQQHERWNSIGYRVMTMILEAEKKKELLAPSPAP